MSAGWQFGISFEMLGAQGCAEVVFFGEPFAEVHQLAALRAERPVFIRKPIAGLAAGRAFDLGQPAHAGLRSVPHFGADGFQIGGHADGSGALDGADFQDRLYVRDGLVELRHRK